MSLTLYGMKIDFYEAGQTQPMIVTTQTADGNVIDWIEAGLYLEFACNTPCQTCSLTDPDFCSSCNPVSGKTILYNNKCYSECPGGTWDAGDGDCQGCGDKCSTC
jgi:hypothetical protein